MEFTLNQTMPALQGYRFGPASTHSASIRPDGFLKIYTGTVDCKSLDSQNFGIRQSQLSQFQTTMP